jgi:hypothetical protein
VNKTSDAPKWRISHRNAFLAALHVLVLAVSLVVHPLVETGADRALPKIFFVLLLSVGTTRLMNEGLT